MFLKNKQTNERTKHKQKQTNKQKKLNIQIICISVWEFTHIAMWVKL